jgi:hypothetical protein
LTSQIAQSYHINYKTIFIVDKGNELSYVGLLLSLLARSPERYLHNPLSLLLFLAGSFGRFFPRQGRNFISRAYVYRSSWTSCLTGCLSSFLSVLAKSMNTQVTQIHSTIVKLRRAIGTNPEAELAADAFFLVNQGYAGLDILTESHLALSSFSECKHNSSRIVLASFW